jgi:DNA-binding NtrC family response regulator
VGRHAVAGQLRNAVARYLALGDLAPAPSSQAQGEASPPEAVPAESAAPDIIERVLAMDLPLARAREHLVREFEQRYVAHVLAQHGGSVTRAAAASGIARRHFQRLKARGTDADDEG